MTIAAAIFLIAVGAILRYATNLHDSGVDIDTVGLILSFFQEMIWSDRARRRRGVVVDDRDVYERPTRDVPPRY